jgi:TP901-1 family phage major tail protein
MSEIGGKNILVQVGYGSTRAVTFTDAGDLVGLTAHGLLAGQAVQFSVITTTTGIVVDTTYYVINPNANDFQVSATVGGSALTLTTNGTGTLKETFTLVGGLREKSFSFAADGIDITNHDSSEWKKLLDSAGIRSCSASGSGVWEDGTIIHQVRVAAMTNALRNFRFIMNSDGDYFGGSFKIVSFELGGAYDGEGTWSASFESSGEVTYTTV